jgi:dissimilatory sulfite reductase (desulfoviridin) alpha/beta subunit
LSYSDTELNKIVDILEKESLNLIHWFSHNQMKANPDKFQAIANGSKTLNESISFNLDGNKIDQSYSILCEYDNVLSSA